MKRNFNLSKKGEGQLTIFHTDGLERDENGVINILNEQSRTFKTSYDKFFGFLNGRIASMDYIRGIELVENKLLVDSIALDDGESYLFEDVLSLDESLQEDITFMEGVRGLISNYCAVEEQTNAKILEEKEKAKHNFYIREKARETIEYYSIFHELLDYETYEEIEEIYHLLEVEGHEIAKRCFLDDEAPGIVGLKAATSAVCVGGTAGIVYLAFNNPNPVATLVGAGVAIGTVCSLFAAQDIKVKNYKNRIVDELLAFMKKRFNIGDDGVAHAKDNFEIHDYYSEIPTFVFRKQN